MLSICSYEITFAGDLEGGGGYIIITENSTYVAYDEKRVEMVCALAFQSMLVGMR